MSVGIKTYSPKKSETLNKSWVLIDAKGVVLGKLAVAAADILRGKNKASFSYHADMGDRLIIINAKDVVLSHNKAEKKIAWSHSGYPGGIKGVKYSDLLEKNPVRVVEKAIKGMMPKNSLSAAQFKKLKVYSGSDHPHKAQKPIEYKFSK